MVKYTKIPNIFYRDPETKKLVSGIYSTPELYMLRNIYWIMTEKVDGTNISVCWDGYNVEFHGRTEKAQIPKELNEKLESMFGTPEVEEIFESGFGEKEAILFGEGYGHKIQKVGDKYNPDGVDFILFDVMIGGNYQPREVVEDIAYNFRCRVVPIVFSGTLEQGVNYISRHPDSLVSPVPGFTMEGVVARPEHELQDRCGNRIITKIKCRDFPIE